MRIEHRSFSFNKPNLIDENEYNSLKEILKKNPSFVYESKLSFWEIYGYEIKYRVILPLIVGIFFGVISNYIKWQLFEIISALCIIYILALFFLRLIWEWISYGIYKMNYMLYYKKLVTKVKKSNNYSEFRNTNKFWINMHPNT